MIRILEDSDNREEYALGSLHSTRGWTDIEERIRQALNAAETFNPCVGKPFVVMDTDNYHRISWED